MLHVTLCYTQTIDGRLATVDGLSQWIGGPESVRYWHQLRAEHDAVMVGVGTLLADNPRLTVRLVEGRNPLRVIVDSTLRMPATAHVLNDGGATNTLLAVTERADPARLAAVQAIGASVLVLPTDGAGRVSLPALLAALVERGIASVMVEGGAQLITALLRERLASRLVVCIAPRLMGAGREAVGELGVRDLAHMVELANVELLRFGADVVLDGRLVYPA
ncbi:MAG: RibD family protein [Chloroflexaceae bacterium]|jgi:5-amino-6-(5-phosphoribosylamino)uracil reductase/diaminohydroxyphosphoribosylaminopyrimidine deaminase/5-amino-6-(5-phosphoribosylamino)uracil reductase|nr:RibD family protein [Chloroflexaceae bacterium]